MAASEATISGEKSARDGAFAKTPSASAAAIVRKSVAATPLGRCARPSQSTATSSVPIAASGQILGKLRRTHRMAGKNAIVKSCSCANGQASGNAAQAKAKRSSAPYCRLINCVPSKASTASATSAYARFAVASPAPSARATAPTVVWIAINDSAPA